MSDTPSTSGADLARQALARARAGAKTGPTPKTRGPKRRRLERGSGRDPQTLGGIVGNLATSEGWADSLGGGNITDQWPALCPSIYVDKTTPVGYDPDTGTLKIRASSYAVASSLRLGELSLAKHINAQMGRTVVRRIRVSIGGEAGPADSPQPAGPPPEPKAPVRTRETASDGYRATLEAALAHKPDRQSTKPYVLEALERQEQALRANRQPEAEHRDALWELDRLTGGEVDRSEAVRRAAIARARQEQAGGPMPRRAFDVA